MSDWKNKLHQSIIVVLLGFFLLGTSCKRDTEHVYEVNDVAVTQSGVNKQNLKSTKEFISIAHSDLFGSTINQSDLTDLSLVYDAFGDKKLIEDMIIRNFLNQPGVSFPSSAEMRADLPLFIEEAYEKFYNRAPNELEAWQLQNLLEKDPSITPELAYYSFMTSDEYRFY